MKNLVKKSHTMSIPTNYSKPFPSAKEGILEENKEQGRNNQPCKIKIGSLITYTVTSSDVFKSTLNMHHIA
jgi:hypothetical protein